MFAVSTDNQDNTTLAPTFMPKLFLVGSIFGKPVRFLLDSGADHSLINSNVIEQFKQWNLPVPDPSGSIMTKSFRGQSKSNLTVVLPCLLSGSEISINMAVTHNLDHDALLGRNFRNIHELIHQATAADPQDILDVQTRAQTQTEAQQDLADQDDQDQDGLEPNPLEDLLGPNYNFPRTNMSHQTDPDSDTHSSGEAVMQQNNAANLIQDQRADETLKELSKSAN